MVSVTGPPLFNLLDLKNTPFFKHAGSSSCAFVEPLVRKNIFG
jgi:hypothetical protein